MTIAVKDIIDALPYPTTGGVTGWERRPDRDATIVARLRAAAAVAAGLADAALGTDTSGSLRVPAAWCGVWALRPTTGSIPRDGVLPLAPSFDTPGPLARDLSTLARVWQVLADDLAPLTPRAPSGLRVRVLDEGVDGCTPEVTAAVEAFIAALESVAGLRERVVAALQETDLLLVPSAPMHPKRTGMVRPLGHRASGALTRA
jgi:Asp-tRNA(Asn)/Glu-tRNA(Gln) amidotransferase A subunit family amidase